MVVKKLVCVVGIWKEGKDCGMEKMGIVRKVDVIVMRGVGKEWDDGSGRVGDREVVRKKWKIWVWVVIEVVRK